LILVAIGSFVFYKLPGSRTSRARAGRTEVAVEGTATTGTSSTRTASSRSTSCARPSGRRRARGVGARLRRSSTRGGSRARRQVRRDPGTHERDLVQRRGAGIYQGQCAELCGVQHAR
jgi:hypothetical protein